MPQLTFKLHSPSVAMWTEHYYRTVVTLPAGACVTIVAGDITSEGSIEISYRDQQLEMSAVDLRNLGRVEKPM